MTGIKCRVEHVAIAVTVLFDAVVLFDSVVLSVPVVRPVIGFVFLTFATGGVVLAAVGVRPSPRARWLGYVVGTSLMVVMSTGLILDLVLSSVGLSNPLTTTPLVLTLSVLTVGTGVLSLRRRPASRTDWSLPDADAVLSRLRRDGWQVAALLLVPTAAILSIAYLNRSNDPTPLLLILAAIATLPVVVTLDLIDEKYYVLAVGSTGLAILYHKSLWAGFTYGGHASTVTIYDQGIWGMSGETLLPNAVLMPAYARVIGVDILTQLQVVMPVMVLFIPVALYVMFRSYVSPSMAYLATALFMFAHPFYFQYPSTPRASIPVLFLALLGTTMSDRDTSPTVRRGLSLLFATGVIVSHYGTSYYVLFALVGALVVLFQFDVVDRLAGSSPTTAVSPDGGQTYDRLGRVFNSTITRPVYVAFYAVAVTAWYYYLDQGTKFASIVENVVQSFSSLLTPGGQGSTATRLATDYGGQSIRYSKYLYLTIAALAGLGLVIAFARRYVPRWDTGFSDEFLSVAALLFVLFGGTFIISGQWGGGRPLMIVLSFNAVFVAVAMATLSRWLTVGCVAAARRLSDSAIVTTARVPVRLPGKAALATVLAVFLLMNTGFMAAVAYGGEAPSNVPQTDVDTIYETYDIDTHAWLADHRDDQYQIYGDRLARAQTTDWLNGEIAARSERTPYRFRRSYFFNALNGPNLETGYVLFMSHNVVEDRVEVDYVTSRPLDAYNLQTEQRNVVYSNGAGRVYFVGNETQELGGRGLSSRDGNVTSTTSCLGQTACDGD